MITLGVIVLDVFAQEIAKVPFAEDHKVIETFCTDGPDKPLGVGICSSDCSRESAARSGTTSDVAPLVTAIKQALLQTRSCTFAMTATLPSGMTTGVKITTNAEKGTFSYNGAPLTYNDPNGWTLTADQTGITLNGSTCDSWKTAGGTLTGSFPCEVTFDPGPPPPPPK
jgi:hypothetical protein